MVNSDLHLIWYTVWLTILDILRVFWAALFSNNCWKKLVFFAGRGSKNCMQIDSSFLERLFLVVD